MTVSTSSADLACRLTGWAQRRYLGPVSVTGISLALAVCAAGWFSGGTPVESLYGGLALCGSYLAWRGARHLARPDPAAVEEPDDGDPAIAEPADGAAAAVPEPADVAAGVEPAGGTTAAGMEPAGRAAAAVVGTGGTVLACVSYAGLAAGGYAAHMGGTWPLATAALIMMAVRDVAGACGGRDAAADGNPVGRAVRGALMFPVGGRVALIAVATPIWGPHVTLLALLEWAVVGTGYALTGRPDRNAVPVTAELETVAVAGAMDTAVPAAAPAGALTAGIQAAGIQAAGMQDRVTYPAPGAATTLDLMIDSSAGGWHDDGVAAQAEPRVNTTALACRDDGPVALRLGRAVKGQFVPLPPALLGLAATSLLAWLGMRNLLGLLLLTPLVVMLLAGFGSTHPHDRALAWLTPAVLLAGQLEYAAAVGFSFRVPPPITFTLCALIALRHVSLARGDQLNTPQGPGARLGWEGRMLIIGIGAMLGIATVAFAALAVQVAVLVGTSVLPRYIGYPGHQAHLRLYSPARYWPLGRADPRAKLYTRRRVA